MRTVLVRRQLAPDVVGHSCPASPWIALVEAGGGRLYARALEQAGADDFGYGRCASTAGESIDGARSDARWRVGGGRQRLRGLGRCGHCGTLIGLFSVRAAIHALHQSGRREDAQTDVGPVLNERGVRRNRVPRLSCMLRAYPRTYCRTRLEDVASAILDCGWPLNVCAL